MWIRRTVASALLLLIGAPLLAAGLTALPSRCCGDGPAPAQQTAHCQWVTPFSCCDQVTAPRDSGVLLADLPTPGLAVLPFIPPVVHVSWPGQPGGPHDLAHPTLPLRLSVVLQV